MSADISQFKRLCIDTESFLSSHFDFLRLCGDLVNAAGGEVTLTGDPRAADAYLVPGGLDEFGNLLESIALKMENEGWPDLPVVLAGKRNKDIALYALLQVHPSAKRLFDALPDPAFDTAPIGAQEKMEHARLCMRVRNVFVPDVSDGYGSHLPRLWRGDGGFPVSNEFIKDAIEKHLDRAVALTFNERDADAMAVWNDKDFIAHAGKYIFSLDVPVLLINESGGVEEWTNIETLYGLHFPSPASEIADDLHFSRPANEITDDD